MADAEEDLSSLPLSDRFVHKNWKVRKEAYEAAAKECDRAQSDSDPVVRELLNNASLWKGAVADSNVAAQQAGMDALISFLNIAGAEGTRRTRQLIMTGIVEKGLTGRGKAKAQEVILLSIESDRPEPVIEELLPFLSHKVPKNIAATLEALTEVFKQYGCRTVEPKPVIKLLPKVYGHADKNVRTQAQNLTVELYRWLKDAMKPLFWNDLKPVQQTDLEKLFEGVQSEAPPKQTRLLRSQQTAQAEAALTGAADEGGFEEAGEVEIDLEPEYEAVNAYAKIPKDVNERLASSKWKDRKDALEDVRKAVDTPLIQEGPFDDLVRAFAKCMKDANVSVVTEAAVCTELLARGLRKAFAKYKITIMAPIMERLKEKKQAVADALGGALDAIFASTGLPDCLEDIVEFSKHKNPQVKLETSKFLIRCLRTTKVAPKPEEAKTIAEAATKLLTDSQETQRQAAAEILGTLAKIMGDRMMAPHMDGLDDIRKTKINEFKDAAEVKSKYSPKSAAPPKPAAAPAAAQKKPGLKKPAGATAPVKKAPGPAKAAPKPAPPPPEPEYEAPSQLQPRPSSKPASRLAGPRGVPSAAASGLKRPGAPAASAQPKPSAIASPQRQPAPRPQSIDQSPPQQRRGLTAPGTLASRTLGKPAPEPMHHPAPSAGGSLTSIEREELEDLRAENERLRTQNEDLKAERNKLGSQITELQNQNAQLIEDHTRDVLTIKAKETQLVRAKSDAEVAEQKVDTQQREVDRLKRELSRQIRATSPPPMDVSEQIYTDFSSSGGERGAANGTAPTSAGSGATRRFDSGYFHRSRAAAGGGQAGSGHMSSGEGKENRPDPSSMRDGKLSPTFPGVGSHNRVASPGSIGSGSRGSADGMVMREDGVTSGGGMGAAMAPSSRDGVESWKRAAEVTQNLKARIELMKAKQGLSRPP